MFKTGNVYVTQNDLTKLPIKLVSDEFNKEGTVKEIKRGLPVDVFAFFTRDGHMENFDIKTFTIDEIEPIGVSSEIVNTINIEKSKKKYLLFVTKNGKAKKTLLSEYLKARKRTKAIKLKGDDELIYVGACDNDDMIYILGEDGKLVKFPALEVNDTSKITIGSKGINGAAVQALVANKNDKIFTMNDKGQAKLTKGSDYIITARGSNGQSITDGVISLLSGESEYLIAYDGKKNNLITSKSLAVKGKTSMGSKISNKEVLGIGN
jgi:DNA gyrase/topoisomerase IV subunit A